MIIVDIIGAYASRIFRFNYGFLAVVSIAAALSPLAFRIEGDSSLQLSLYSLVIYGPETFFGALAAYKIDAQCGSYGSYRKVIYKYGWPKIIFECIMLWFIMAGIVFGISRILA